MNKPELFFNGEDGHVASKPYHYKECGLDNVHLMNGFHIEKYDGEEYVQIDNVEGLWKAIGFNLVTSQKNLSPKEIRFLRQQMDKTQAELARFLRVDDQTVARWEKGKATLPGPADVALRVLFLSSDVAQPEGKRVLSRWVDMVRDLIEKDSPMRETIVFAQHNSHWERERTLACA